MNTADFLSDGSTSLRSYSFRSNVEAELHAARLNLSEEIEKRKKAEEALVLMRNQWQRIVCHLSQAALSFPMTSETGETPLEIESVEQSCQEYIFLKFVSEAVVRDQARAETEADAKAIIDAKNQEIARLQDKLQYCETVNREMSQRNREIMGMFLSPFDPTFHTFCSSPLARTEATAGVAVLLCCVGNQIWDQTKISLTKPR